MAYINKINVDGVEYEVQDENALPATDLPDAINTALAQAKESGEFDGPQGPAGESGVYVGTDTPPEGTKVWINPDGVATFPMPTADDAGKVLTAKGANEAEWGEASGESEEWEYFGQFDIAEDVSSLFLTEDAGGNPFQLKKMYFEPSFIASSATTTNTTLHFSNPAWGNNVSGSNYLLATCSWIRTTNVKCGTGGGWLWEVIAPTGLVQSINPSGSGNYIMKLQHGDNAGINYIGGLSMKVAADTGVIGAGSYVKIWGVRA